MNSKWLSGGVTVGSPSGNIDYGKGVIEGVSVNTTGEAKGHGVHLDAEFVQAVIEQGNEKKQGLKARFGHPNMCSTALGTFIGRFKNFRGESFTRDDGSEAFRAVADLFLSNSAKDAPQGDFYDYVMKMAQTEPDMFGTSIVFTPGRVYRKRKDDDEKAYRKFDGESSYVWSNGEEVSEEDESNLSDEIYVEMESLHACDVVDDPAANDGLFSRFSQETVAGQITEFLDLHPQIFNAIQKNPNVLAALAQYGEKVDEFITRYRNYREHSQKGENMSNEAEATVATPEAETPAPEATEINQEAAEPANETPETPEAAEPEAETTSEQTPEQPETEQPESELSEPEIQTDSRAEFKAMKAEFGAEIAADIFELGGSYQDALKLAYDRKCKEAEALTEKVESLSASAGTAAEFSASPKDSKVINGVHVAFSKGTRALKE